MDYMVLLEVSVIYPVRKGKTLKFNCPKWVWQLVGWILLHALPSGTSRGVKSVGKRTITSGCIIFAANIYGGMLSELVFPYVTNLQFKIYQSDDTPGAAVILWLLGWFIEGYLVPDRTSYMQHTVFHPGKK
ncbi:hypothetical protein EDD18DRAFT_1107761 [Armillaria luteobubalina]|uniref:Uncharacterized protein n=1 Tax=Armillaria luteobubalina TaxID=153913 RepID=A0AA39Q2U5_9AGAR|nr:hypothetical protein EDD18DRAFT_1107761 [Armillaria luteobubalina]